MTNLFYTGLSKKNLKTNNLSRVLDKLSLLSEKKINFDIYTDTEIIEGYCNDLMMMLEEDDLQTMISGIFQIYNQLGSLSGERNIEKLSPFDDFFRKLSPLLLQVAWENLDQDADQFLLFKKWKEAIRVSLEEELYLWQDRL